MPNFKSRSLEKELLDQPGIPFEEIALNMQELNTINTLLGGHSISLAGFKTILQNRRQISVCEIGCGGGDNLLVIYNYCQTNHIDLTLTGIDINKACIDYAKQNPSLMHKTNFICSDYALVEFEQKPDIIFSSLFCHHFSDTELANQLSWMRTNSNCGFFINDLHRHWLAYYSIKCLTTLFSTSRLVKNDAALSVARGFVKTDWLGIFHNAGIQEFTIQWKWAFRHLLIFNHGR